MSAAARSADEAPDERAPRSELDRLEVVFRALAHASRRHILLVLHSRGGAMLAGDIAGRFACSWPTTTRHLRVLRDAGLVRVEAHGRERVYRLDRDRLAEVVGGWLAHFDERPLLDSAPPREREPS